MPEDAIQQKTDGERGRFVQLWEPIEAAFWKVAYERDNLLRAIQAIELETRSSEPMADRAVNDRLRAILHLPVEAPLSR